MEHRSTRAPEHWRKEFKYVISEYRHHDSAGGSKRQQAKGSATSSGEMTFSDYDADLQHEAGDNAAPVNG